MSSDDLMTNHSNNEHFHQVLDRALQDPQRRNMLRGGFGLGVLSFLGLPGCGLSGEDSGTGGGLGFSAVPLNQTYDGVTVPAGYQFQVLYKLGDPIDNATAAYANNGTDGTDPNPASANGYLSFDKRAGDHHDGMYLFGMGSANTWDKTVSNKGLLCINHEAITPLFLHPNGPSATPRPEIEIQKEFRLHGVSVIEVTRSGSTFQVNTASPFNRRITTLTPMELRGPLRGKSAMVTKYSTNATQVQGTVNNCASGYTPWGTYLTCEENWAGYFKITSTAGRDAKTLAGDARYGVSSSSGRELWASGGVGDDYARWDVTIKAASADLDFRNAAHGYGYNVEIDPFAPASTPVKRTAMGRFAHEGAWVGPVTVGQPVVFYMGCDSRNEYIYKFVSTENWRAEDVNGGLAAGDRYLNSGKLYVAKFNSDFSGQWLEITGIANGTSITSGTQTFNWDSSVDPYLNTRLGADKVGATPMDRPEWGAVNPKNGEVYITLTNNDSRRSPDTADAANPRSYKDNASSSAPSNPNGHIIRWRETGSNPAATSFIWDIYVFGAESDDMSNPQVNLSGLDATNLFSSPDGLWFSEKTGIMYIQTDDGAFTNESAGNGSTCMLLAAIPGTVGDGSVVTVTNTKTDGTTKSVSTRVGKPGTIRRLLTGPLQCEITGITETADGKALLVNVQHPGEDTAAANINSPASSWPYATTTGNPPSPTAPKSNRPRSATIVITRVDGGVIGQA